MNAVLTILRAAEETTEAVKIDPIVTEYSDLKIPVLTMIMMGLAVVLLLGVLIFAFITLINRTERWGTGLIAGLGAYLIFCSLLFMGLQALLNVIPFTKESIEANPEQFQMIMTILSGIFACVAVLLALKYVQNQMMKRGHMMTIGVPISIGVGMLTATTVLNQEITNTFQYLMMSISINQMGFDEAVTQTVQSMLANGEYTLEEATKIATDSIRGVCTEPSISFLLNALYYVGMGIVETAAAILVYGWLTEKMEQKWSFVGFGFLMLSVVPTILTSFASVPGWIGVLMIIVIAAAAAFITIKLGMKYMPEEMKSLTYNHRKNGGSGGFGGRGRKDNTPPKMPHIVMPTDK